MNTPQKSAPKNMGDAILLINRQNARTLIRDELKAAGISNFHMPDTASRCLSIISHNPDAIFVLDWEIGQDQVVKVLSHLAGEGEIQFRPILMIAIELTESVVGTAAEYEVSRIHSGEITKPKIRAHVEALIAEKESTSAVKQGLRQVASCRLNNDWKQSLDILRQLVQLDPENQRIAAEFVENLIHMNEWEEASAVAKRLSETEPGYPRALNLYGRILMKEKKFSEAVEVFKRANVLNPMNVGRLVSLGKSLLKIDKITEAREQFEHALKLQRGRKDASIGLGECALLEGDVNEALDLLKDFSSERELASLFNSAAILSMRQGRYEIGKKLYQVAMRSVGDDNFLLSRLVFNLGIGYYRWQRGFDALECFEKAAQMDKKYEDAKLNAAVLARKLETSSKIEGGKPSKPGPSIDQFRGEFNEDEFEEESIPKK